MGPEGEGLVATVRGDWDDVEAAVLVGASRAEMAVLRDRPLPEGGRRFDLLAIDDESVVLTASREPRPAVGAEHAEPGPIRLHARVGRFGDSDRERRLLAAVAARLHDLAGVDYRPLD